RHRPMHSASREDQSGRSVDQSRTRFSSQRVRQLTRRFQEVFVQTAVYQAPRQASRSIYGIGIVLALSLGLLSGCGQPNPPAAPTPPPAPVAPEDLNLQGAIKFIAEDLARQLGPGERTLVIDPLLDRTSGQQTGASSQVEQAIKAALPQTFQNLTILPFDADGAAKSRLILTGTVATVTTPDK